MGDLERPFREVPGEPFALDLDSAVIAGGVVIMAAVMPTPDGPMPCVVFKFARVDGSGYADPIVLALHDRQMVTSLPKLVKESIATARAHARE